MSTHAPSESSSRSKATSVSMTHATRARASPIEGFSDCFFRFVRNRQMVAVMSELRGAAHTDLTAALSIAVGAVALGSFLPWANGTLGTTHGTSGAGNLTLLLAGTAGALVARWRVQRGV